MIKLKSGVYYTPEEAALKLGIGRMTIYRWLKKGRIKGLHIGDLLRFHESDLAPLLKIKEINDKIGA